MLLAWMFVLRQLLQYLLEKCSDLLFCILCYNEFGPELGLDKLGSPD